MPHSSKSSFSLENFSGEAPLFPLAEAALFPHALLPLQLIEPWHRHMMSDLLAGDRTLAMAQLRPGWERLPPTTPPAIYEHVCLGQIVADEMLPEGRYCLIVQGMARARVVFEEPDERPYRVACLELRPDQIAPTPCIDRENRRCEILEAIHQLHPRFELDYLFHEAAEAASSLSLVCDAVAAALRLPPPQAQEILAEADIDLRSDLVLARLRELLRKQSVSWHPTPFPPEFSQN